MGRILQKYFIALVPEGEIQEKATLLKRKLEEKYGIRYALKSPAHITLKMPFLWNEKKENVLQYILGKFFSPLPEFQLHLRDFGKFGKRVIFIKVNAAPELMGMQEKLVVLCKEKLKLPSELSDTAYHPHMTIAFKDLKKALFDKYYQYTISNSFQEIMAVHEAFLLKRCNGKWIPIANFPFSKI